ncbi:MAG: hypothetical protein D3924_11690 [Candidatus Electrothrix sp. AR4]|nr:hypothetical protein [Candidatus Electrothrix sp. AR4]
MLKMVQNICTYLHRWRDTEEELYAVEFAGAGGVFFGFKNGAAEVGLCGGKKGAISVSCSFLSRYSDESAHL